MRYGRSAFGAAAFRGPAVVDRRSASLRPAWDRVRCQTGWRRP
jgi:hypothetical protein